MSINPVTRSGDTGWCWLERVDPIDIAVCPPILLIAEPLARSGHVRFPYACADDKAV